MTNEEANDEHKSDDEGCHDDCEGLGAARAAASLLRRRQQPGALLLLYGKTFSSACFQQILSDCKGLEAARTAV